MDKKSPNSNPELWGGIECTINRVQDRFFDQLRYSGHYNRDEDIDNIAALGVKSLRYPILWEFHEPRKGMEIDWSWITARLEKIRSHNILPIAGLVHHGSGPNYTNLLDDNFPELLAGYAKKVAIMFPWLEYYTPVNEPLTTARFSGLYGLWYPHATNDISFARMLINQMKAVVLAMKAIREINPHAKLIQTEDLGKTYCSKRLYYQATFENERRWLSFDLLCGKVKPGHRMWAYFKRLGIPEESMEFFTENPCPPDVMGFNYYVTSERYIDENLSKYPECTYGGNELQEYADVEAIRIKMSEPHGLAVLLREAASRYSLPMAITECHLSCTREEQMRWFAQTWDSCKVLVKEGYDIRAVTAWSLFGAHGWKDLLTSKKMEYESGIFDIRSPNSRPTALAGLIKSLDNNDESKHPLIKGKGWWQRDLRFSNPALLHNVPEEFLDSTVPPILILGKTGTLGKAFAKTCYLRGLNYKLFSREELDITDKYQVQLVIQRYKPWAVINAAGFVRVDEAEHCADKCFDQNTYGVANLSDACLMFGARFVSFSSDLVFDGKKMSPYLEDDVVNPLNVYGQSKAKAEKIVLEKNVEALIIRTSAFFGPWDDYNFVTQLISSLAAFTEFEVVPDMRVSPTYLPDLVNNSLDLLIDGESGIWHLANEGDVSWADLAYLVAEKAGLDENLLKLVSLETANFPAKRPAYSVLGSSRGRIMPTLSDALTRYLREKAAHTVKVSI